jgi:hypothetical protein
MPITHKQVITITLAYDPTSCSAPADWNWIDILDLGGAATDVVGFEAGAVEELSPEVKRRLAEERGE